MQQSLSMAEEYDGNVTSGSDPLSVVLHEIRQSERRTEERLRRLETDMQGSQEEAVGKAAK